MMDRSRYQQWDLGPRPRTVGEGSRSAREPRHGDNSLPALAARPSAGSDPRGDRPYADYGRPAAQDFARPRTSDHGGGGDSRMPSRGGHRVSPDALQRIDRTRDPRGIPDKILADKISMERALTMDKVGGVNRLQFMGARLWKLGEEHKQDSDWASLGERVRLLREELMEIVDALSMSSGRKSDYSYVGENDRLRRELADRDGKIAALEMTFLAYVPEREKSKARYHFFRHVALASRFALFEDLLLTQLLLGWSNIVKADRYEREAAAVRIQCRKQNFSVKEMLSGKTAKEDERSALLAMFKEWQAGVLEQKTEKHLERSIGERDFVWQEKYDRLHKTVVSMKRDINEEKMKAAQLAFGGMNRAFLTKTFRAWCAGILDQRKDDRTKDDRLRQALATISNSNEMLTQLMMQSWQKYAKKNKAKGKAMKGAMKQLGLSNLNLLKALLIEWLKVNMKLQQDGLLHKAQQAAKLANDEARRAKMGLVDRAFGSGQKAALDQAFQAWAHELQAKKMSLNRKMQGKQVLLRKMMGNQEQLLGLCVSEWEKVTKNEKFQAKLGSAEYQARMVAMAREKAISMMKKSMGNALEALVAACIHGWTEMIREIRKNEQRAAQATRQINDSFGAIQHSSMVILFNCWSSAYEIDQAAKRLASASLRMAHIGRGAVMRLKTLLVTRLAFTWWYVRAAPFRGGGTGPSGGLSNTVDGDLMLYDR